MQNVEFPLDVVMTPSKTSQLVNDAKFVSQDNIKSGDNIIVQSNADGSVTINANGGGGGGDGATFTPVVSQDTPDTITISWTNNKGLPNPQSVTVTAPKGDPGTAGEKGDKGDTPILMPASQTTLGGVRMWLDGDTLNISTENISTEG